MSTHVGSTVVQNCKETCGTFLGMPLNTVHDQQAAGGSNIGHIEAAGIGGCDNIEVLNIILAGGIAVAILSILCRVGHRNVSPLGILGGTGIAVIVVDPHAHIIPCYISRCHIVNNLIAIGIGCIVDLLRDAGRQNLGFGIEHGEAGVCQVFHIVTGDTAHLVCKCIAGSLTQFGQFGSGSIKGTGAFQSCNQLIAGVSIVHRSTQILAGAQSIQSVGQQVADTLLQRQTRLVILSHHLFQITGFVAVAGQFIHEVERIQVCIQVTAAKRTGRTRNIVIEQVLLMNVCNFFFQSQIRIHTEFIHGTQQVSQITDPAANVRMVLTVLVVVGHIHGTEEVATQIGNLVVRVGVHLIAEEEVSKLLQTGDVDPYIDVGVRVNSIFCFLNIFQEILVFGACHNRPGAGSIVFNSGTHIIQHQREGILTGMLHSILLSHHFQIADVAYELIGVINLLDFHHGNLDVSLGCFTTEFAGMFFVLFQSLDCLAKQAVIVCSPADGAIGCLLGIAVHPLVLQHRDGICIIIAVQAVACAQLMTSSVTGCGNLRTCNNPVVICHRDYSLCYQNLAAVIAVRAFGQAGRGTGCGNCRIHNNQMFLLGIKVQVAAITCRSIAQARIIAVPVVAKCGDHFLCNPEFITLLALPTRGHTVFRTGSRNFLSNGNTEMLLAVDNLILCVTQGTQIDDVRGGITAMVAKRFTLVPDVSIRVNGQDLHIGLLAAFVHTAVDNLTLCLTSCLGFFTVLCPGVVLRINRCYDRLQQLVGIAVSKVHAAIGAVPVSNNTLCLAGGSNCLYFFQRTMALSGNNFLCNQSFAAGLAVRAFGQTGCSTGRCNRCVNNCSVAQGINYFLCHQSLATNLAVGAFGQTGCSTGRSDCCVNNCSVAQGINYFLCDQSLATGLTVGAFGQTGCGTSGSDSCVNNRGVAQSFYNLLCDQSLATGLTVGAFSQTGCGAGGSNRCINNCGMAQCGDKDLVSCQFFGCLIVFEILAISLTPIVRNVTLGFAACSNSCNILQMQGMLVSELRLKNSAAISALDIFRFRRLVAIRGMSRCIHNFLRNQSLATNLAVGAFGQTGCSTGRCDCCVNNCSVAQSINYFLCNQSLATNLAVGAFGQTGCSTGRCDCCVNNCSVAQSINYFLCNQSLATNLAVGALSQTGCGTSWSDSCVNNCSMAQGINYFLCHQRLAAGLAVGALSQTGCGTSWSDSCVNNCSMAQGCCLRIGIAVITAILTGMGGVTTCSTGGFCHDSFVLVPQLRDCFCVGSSAAVALNGLHAISQTGCSCSDFFNISTFRISMLTSPGSIDRLVNPFTGIRSSFNVGAISVLQLGRGNGNLNPFFRFTIRTRILYLMGFGLRARLQNDGAGTADICAAGSGINITGRKISRAVNFHISIFASANYVLGRCRVRQIDVSCIRRTAERGTFAYGICSYVRRPLIIVVDIDFVAATQSTGCALIDNQPCTGLQGNVLSHGNRTATAHGNGDIAVDRQYIVPGIDGFATQQAQPHGNRQALDTEISININQQTAGSFIIVLHNSSAGDVKHTVGADEGNRCALNADHRNSNGHIAIFRCACFQSHGNFHILDVVLREWEYSIGVSDHAGCIVAAAPVRNLEALIDSGAALDCHGAIAGNVTPGIQFTTIVDGNAATRLHFNKTGRAVR